MELLKQPPSFRLLERKTRCSEKLSTVIIREQSLIITLDIYERHYHLSRQLGFQKPTCFQTSKSNSMSREIYEKVKIKYMIIRTYNKFDFSGHIISVHSSPFPLLLFDNQSLCRTHRRWTLLLINSRDAAFRGWCRRFEYIVGSF